MAQQYINLYADELEYDPNNDYASQIEAMVAADAVTAETSNYATKTPKLAPSVASRLEEAVENKTTVTVSSCRTSQTGESEKFNYKGMTGTYTNLWLVIIAFLLLLNLILK